MEDSHELHSEDDKAFSEKNKKRKVKTNSQREALEKFYDEHKYPTESMKLEVAKRIGLTEKQISSWFCHRRLKDKKISQGETHGNGKQDRSSGVIQDLGSGHKQDSCGSTKQGNEKTYDPREVESRILAGQELSVADLTYDRSHHYVGNFSRMDDTSSGSNSSLRNLSFKEDPVDMATSRYASQKLSANANSGKVRSGPSGYLKVKGRVENAAITAVKRQLGRHYREDGPPLGIEFDPLPPGAFESPGQDPVTEPYYGEEDAERHSPNVPGSHEEHVLKRHHVDERSLSHSSDAFKLRKQQMSGTGYGYPLKRGAHVADLDGKKCKTMHGSDHSETGFHQKSEQKISSSKHRSMYLQDCSAREVAVPDGRVKYEVRTTTGVGGGSRTDPVGQFPNLQPPGEEGTPEKAMSWLHNKENKVSKVPPGSYLQANPKDLTVKGLKYSAVEDGGLSRKAAKVNKKYGGRRVVDDDNNNDVQVNLLPKNEMRNYQRFKDDFSDMQYPAKASRESVPQWTNHQMRRPAAEVPSSFSEDDETVETSSSSD